MTKRKRRETPDARERSEVVEVEDGGIVEETDVPSDVMQVLAQLGGEASIVQLWRRDARRKFAYIDECAPEEFDLKMLRDVYGGGDYQVRFLDASRRYLKAQNFTIDGPAKPVPGSQTVERASGMGAAPAVAEQSVLMELVKMLREDIRAATIREGTQSGNPLELAMQMAKMMQDASINTIQAMGLKGGGRDSLSLSDLLTAIPKFMELAKEYAGDGTKRDEDDMLFKLGAEVIELMKQQQGQPGTRATQPRLPAAPDPSKPPWVAFFARYMPQLLAWAGAGKDTALYAEVMLDNMPAAAQSFLSQQVHRGAAFLDEFYLHFPDAANHKWWFDGLYRELGTLLRDGDDEGDDDAGRKPDADGTERATDAD